MVKHILGQSVLHLIIMLVVIFNGENFLPEYSDNSDLLSTPQWIRQLKINPVNPGNFVYLEFVRSGRYNKISSAGIDYGLRNAMVIFIN